METQLLEHYNKTVAPEMREKMGYKNPHQVPKIIKVVMQSHVGKEADRKQAVEDAREELTKITGQRPIVLLAKRSVSNFKVREGEAVGVKVTLRGRQMYEFLQRLMLTSIPSIRDFRGVPSKSFDGRGNYTLGISDQTIFPEVELDRVKRNIGFDVNIVTTAETDDDARELLTLMGMPFRKPSKPTPEAPTQAPVAEEDAAPADATPAAAADASGGNEASSEEEAPATA